MGIAVATLVVLLAVSHITRHQRAYRAIEAELDLRTRLRDASDILVASLRGISSSADSIMTASDTAVEFHLAIGASTVCTAPAPSVVTIPADTLPTGRVLSAWAVPPDTGDVMLIFIDSSATSGRRWERTRITSFATVPTAVACPPSSGLLSAGDAATAVPSYQIGFSPSITATVASGAPVRFTRRVRYSVYRAGDGKWYLGYHRCAAICATIQPVSGPYERAAGPPISFRYFTAGGVPLESSGPTADVARIQIVSHASYGYQVSLPGLGRSLGVDSAVATVALRNR